MSTDPRDLIRNMSGHVWHKRGGSERASTADVIVRDAEIHVEYIADGDYLPATDIDDACYPTCRIKSIEIGGVDVTRLIGDSRLREEIASAVEAQWVQS